MEEVRNNAEKSRHKIEDRRQGEIRREEYVHEEKKKILNVYVEFSNLKKNITRLK